MTSSPNNQRSETETLNPSSTQTSVTTMPVNIQDSPNQTRDHQDPPPTIDQVSSADTTTATDDDHCNGCNLGDKRKREDTEQPEMEQSLHPYYKTSLCSYFRRNSGSCSHGSDCKYAHGEEELRPRPDNTWDPTSERAKKSMKLEETNDDEDEDKEEGIMMTEMLVDNGEAEGGEGGCLDPELSKCLVNLPRKWTSDNLKKFLSDQDVHFKLAKKKKGMTVGFVTFDGAEKLKHAIEELSGFSVGNKIIKVADVIPRSYDKKIKSAMAYPKNTSQKMESSLDVENAEVCKSSDVTEGGETIDDSSILDGSSLKAKSARDAVTPLSHMPYEDQLEHKKSSIMQMLKKLTRNTRKACPHGVSLPEWVLKSKEIGGLACKLEGILESPVVNGYRNKCEFSVGYSLQGKPIVGFMLGNFRDGVTAVEEPADCPNVSSIACKYASIFQDFLQQSSLPIWNRFNNTGFWRQLTVREGRAQEIDADGEICNVDVSEVMLIVQVRLAGFDDEVINNELERLSHAFASGATANSPPLPLTVLVLQDHQGISNVAPADAPLRILPLPYAESSFEVEDSKNVVPITESSSEPVATKIGVPNVESSTDVDATKIGVPNAESSADVDATKIGVPYAKISADVDATKNVVDARIHDHISNLQFSISPTAFFQVNTLAAEKLYSLAGDWAGLGPDTLLFDICCGTGTIGLTLAHRVGMVVGIEMNASAVSDAHRNAAINGIKNCRFVCAKAENVMASLLKEYLNGPQKPDELPNTFGSDDTDVTSDQCKDTPMDNENTSHELDADKVGSGSLQNVGQENQSEVHKSSTSENGNSSPQFKNVVAIVDPPRGGLHPIVIKVLRTHSHLRRLVYISCNPETLVANAIELCTPSPEKIEKGNKNNRGWRNMSNAGLARHRAKSMPISEPFQPVKAMAVDLFPHTTHCEMVMLLER